jgi:1-acyl-sn-glycerol-3-phosphate acyltransferase
MTWLRIFYLVVILALVTLVLLPAQLICLGLDLPLRRRLPRLWHRVACHALGIKVHVHGSVEAAKPLLLVVNHVSWKDIMILGSVVDVAFIAKNEVRNWPIFGLLSRLQKTVFVAREDKRKAGAQVNEIAQRLAGGEIIVLFPEGTTSDGNRLLPVKSSLFGAASSAADQVPGQMVNVQPVAIAYTGIQGMAMGRYHRSVAAWPGTIELLPSLMGLMRAGNIDVDLCFGETIPFHRGDNRKALSMSATTAIRDMLNFALRGGWRKSR